MSALATDLGDENAQVRAKACSKLARAGEEAVPTLTEALYDENPLTRVSASNALIQIGGKVVPALVGRIREKLDIGERDPGAAIWTLGLLLGRDSTELTRVVELLDRHAGARSADAARKLLEAWRVDEIE